MPVLAYRREPEAPPSPDVPAFQARALCLAWPGSSEAVLENIDLSYPQGGRIALVGANGAGKSTLLKALSGLLAPAGGSLEVLGRPPGALPSAVAYLPQRGEIDWHYPIDVEHFARTGAYPRAGWLRRTPGTEREKVLRALDQLDMLALRRRRVHELSGGQQQRLLLARTLVQGARLYLLDEPLNAVDRATRGIVERILARLLEEGRTVVMATHDLGRLEAEFDHAAYLADGAIIDAPPGAPDPCHTHAHEGAHPHAH
jgi:manganese/zinc/iron transport system ATP- binding protein